MPEYRAFGLRLQSDFELPHLDTTGPVIPGPATIVMAGRVADPPADAHEVGPTLHVYGGGEMTFVVPGLARFLIREGREVIVAPDDDVATIDFASVLTGPVLALVCHQRGLLPLHASAVEVIDGCVLFVGPPCVGKSTVAAVLCRRGHSLIADDLCVVHAEGGNPPVAYPGPPSLRLWKDTLTALGVQPDRLPPVRPGIDKYVLPVPHAGRAVQVRHVVVIDSVEHRQGVDRHIGIDAVAVLMAHCWIPGVVRPLGATERHFRLTAAVAKAAAIWHWSRPDDIAMLPGSLAGLEAAWRATVRNVP